MQHLLAVTEQDQQPNAQAPVRLGTTLVQAGHITHDQLRIALQEQKDEPNEMLGTVLLRLGFIGQKNLTQALAERAGVTTFTLSDTTLDHNLLERAPSKLYEKHMILPIKLTAQHLDLAMADPFDIVAIDTIRSYFPRQIDVIPHVVSKTDLQEMLSTLKDSFDSFDEILKALESYEEPKEINEFTNYEHPIIRLVNYLLTDAARKGASDIHFEPEDTHIRIRYRLDGVLQQIQDLHLNHWPSLSHRIKIMANMNIADTRSIQDGRFSQDIFNNTIDFRVAIMPSVWGESISIRLLDHNHSLIPLEQLGYNNQARTQFNLVMHKPQGITFVTGPTGSGKTTTLYSLLRELSNPDIHIMTLEDPIEFQLPLIRQTAIQESQGLTFASGVRGLLRMDPDIILIGEIRDKETAQMALRAAMTGHQVYTTLHTNDALGTLPRLIDLGLNPRVLAGNISCMAAQRLVRKLCPHCAYHYEATLEEKMLLGLDKRKSIKLAEAKGCPQCQGTGRNGRTVISEIIVPTANLDALLASNASPQELRKQAIQDGYTTMQQDAFNRLLAHDVALSDLKRTVDMTRTADPLSSEGR